jgi:hypothetical protein
VWGFPIVAAGIPFVVDQKENARLKKLVADLSLDKQILKEVSSGNF